MHGSKVSGNGEVLIRKRAGVSNTFHTSVFVYEINSVIPHAVGSLVTGRSQKVYGDPPYRMG